MKDASRLDACKDEPSCVAGWFRTPLAWMRFRCTVDGASGFRNIIAKIGETSVSLLIQFSFSVTSNFMVVEIKSFLHGLLKCILQIYFCMVYEVAFLQTISQSSGNLFFLRMWERGLNFASVKGLKQKFICKLRVRM